MTDRSFDTENFWVHRSVSRYVVIWTILGAALSAVFLSLLKHGVIAPGNLSPIFRYLLTTYDSTIAWVACVVVVAAAGCAQAKGFRAARFDAAVARVSQHAGAIAFAYVAVVILSARLVYHSYPLSMDEYAAVFQAKIFASGAFSAHLPPRYLDWLVVKGFNPQFLVASHATGEVVEEYWPGFSLLLAPFEFLGLRSACNALLAGAALYLIHRITFEITRNERAAGWAVLFALASAVFAANAISLYAMQAHLTLNLAFAALLMRDSARRAFAAGLIGSWALVLHNPMPHALFAAPWAFALLQDRARRRLGIPLTLGYLPGLALGGAWLLLRLHILGPDSRVPFGQPANAIFAWPDASIVAIRWASAVKMWVWAVPGLFILAAAGAMRAWSNPHVRTLAWSGVISLVGYFFVSFDQGHGWGSRYFHSAWGVIPVLAACAMAGISSTQARLRVFVGVATLLSVVCLLPLQLMQMHEFVAEHLAQIGPPRRPGSNVYFLRPGGGFYVADMVQIDPLLRDQDLLLVSRGEDLDRQMVLENWPDAIRIAGTRASEQWYLGAVEQRVPTDEGGVKRFRLN